VANIGAAHRDANANADLRVGIDVIVLKDARTQRPKVAIRLKTSKSSWILRKS